MRSLVQPGQPASGRISASRPPQPRPVAREIELKFLVDEVDFEASQHWAVLGRDEGRRVTAQRLRTVYFDTEERLLCRHRMFLRVRARRNRYTMAFKWAGTLHGAEARARAGGVADGIFERGEIEVAMRTPDPDPALLGEDIVGEITRVTGGLPLVPFFATDIRRAVYRVALEASEIEVAFDSGFIVAGAQKASVREIELELKSGDPADLYRFGLILAEAFPVRLGIMSKAQRGVLLSSGASAGAVKATPPLTRGQNVDDALGAMIGSCITQFVANWPAFEAGNGPEPVHQMRVAMRRMRSLLGLFQRSFPCAEFAGFSQDAKRIASAMGEARNWDVFDDLVRSGPLEAFADEAGFAPVLDAIGRRREAGYDTVRALLADGATTRFVLSVQAFVARRGWRNAVPGVNLPVLSRHASGFAGACLDRLAGRVRKRGRHLLDLPAAERHDVRIALKKLRYAADGFAGLFDDHSAIRAYTRAASGLQDALGSYNDMQMTAGLARQLDTGDNPEAARAIGITIGWYGRGGREGDGELRTAWKKFRKARPFWTHGSSDDMVPVKP